MKQKKTSVGIIGCGFVGSAVLNGFKYYTDVKVYDKFKNLGSLEEVLKQDVLFVCVPTPSDDEGSCDTSIVRGVFEEMTPLADWAMYKVTKPVILKSTIPPGCADELQAEFPAFEVIHSPEFLTERIAGLDFATQTRVILGRDGGTTQVVRSLFEACFQGIQVLECSWKAAALVKYGVNCFFATKISFMNELAQICSSQGVDPDEVLSLMKNDGRIARHHMDVPGHDGKPGFGGACFPKDTRALASIARSGGVKPTVLEAVMEKNDEVRDGEV
jgi:UDPglucose 6-dehydrogenase